MDHGANPLQSNLKGKTPIDVHYNDDILRLLQRRSETASQSERLSSSTVAQSSSATADSCDDGTMSPPMSVSPMSVGGFIGEWGLRVLLSELVWIGVPALVVVLAARGVRKILN